MAQLGARLIDSTAKSMADQFFDRFAAQVAPPVPAVAEMPAAAPAVAEGGWAPGGLMDQVSRVLAFQFMGMPIQVWFGLAAMLLVMLLIFASG
jgi:hypothetical protein